MKACAVCRRLYAPEASFCQADGSALVAASEVVLPEPGTRGLVGSVVAGRYRVYRVVADGGMARVFEALDTQEDRQVALKVLHPEMLRDGISLERLKREYSAGRQLHHEHIVAVMDFQATEGGSHALVMEFLVGEELRAVLKREKLLAPARLVRMLSQLALGLDSAHQQFFIHRDLKPENIFLCQTPEGDNVKILDFGSVKDKSDTRQLTVMGTTIGSPFYMSPEQAQGLDSVDHRTDIWALGAIIYECVTGSVPFEGNNGPTILFQILSAEPVPPSRKASAVPSALDRVLERAMHKDPEGRPARVAELADAVGHAYGVQGDHRLWAGLSQSELEQQIAARPPTLKPKGASVEDEFFAGRPGLASPLSSIPTSAVLSGLVIQRFGRGRALLTVLVVVLLVVIAYVYSR